MKGIILAGGSGTRLYPSTKGNPNYKEWINLSRGIGMLLVVMGHAIADCFDRGGVRILCI